MKAFILAAGRGERMRPLTDTIPKPLLAVGSETLLDRQIDKLVAAGITDIIVNISYLGDLIARHVGDGSRYGASIHLSYEPEPLETAGAIVHASEALGDADFILVNGDVWMDVDYRVFLAKAPKLAHRGGHLVLVNNPPHRGEGDFCLDKGDVRQSSCSERHSDTTHLDTTYTFSGLSILSPSLIHAYPKCRQAFPLREVFDWAIAENRLTGEHYDGYWLDVGTPTRLDELRSLVLGGNH